MTSLPHPVAISNDDCSEPGSELCGQQQHPSVATTGMRLHGGKDAASSRYTPSLLPPSHHHYTTITLTPSLSIGTYSQCSALWLDASSYHLMRTSWSSRRMIIYVLSQSGIVLSYLLFWSMVVRVLVLDTPLLYE